MFLSVTSPSQNPLVDDVPVLLTEAETVPPPVEVFGDEPTVEYDVLPTRTIETREEDTKMSTVNRLNSRTLRRVRTHEVFGTCSTGPWPVRFARGRTAGAKPHRELLVRSLLAVARCNGGNGDSLVRVCRLS